jgi:hypothetical protein
MSIHKDSEEQPPRQPQRISRRSSKTIIPIGDIDHFPDSGQPTVLAEVIERESDPRGWAARREAEQEALRLVTDETARLQVTNDSTRAARAAEKLALAEKLARAKRKKAPRAVEFFRKDDGDSPTSGLEDALTQKDLDAIVEEAGIVAFGKEEQKGKKGELTREYLRTRHLGGSRRPRKKDTDVVSGNGHDSKNNQEQPAFATYFSSEVANLLETSDGKKGKEL